VKLAAAVLALAVSAVAAAASARVAVEDWTSYQTGARGIPPGWTGQYWGSPAYDFEIADDQGQRALHMRSRGDRSTISRDIRGRVHLKDTPILEWRWKAVTLPTGGDARRRETTDQAAQVYVGWPRFPGPLRSRIIGYAWDTTAPAGSVIRSKKTDTVTYVILRSGTRDLGQWLSERRDVTADYRTIFGEEPGDPGFVSLSIDSNDTRSSAESFIGPIAFVAR
jgi:hypothetical protein